MSIFGKGWHERLDLMNAVFELRRALKQPYPTLDELDRIRDIAANRR